MFRFEALLLFEAPILYSFFCELFQWYQMDSDNILGTYM